MQSSAAHIANGKGGKFWHLLLKRNVPAPRVGIGKVVRLRGERQRKGVRRCSTWVVDRTKANCRGWLEGSVAAQLHRIADADPLHKAAATGTNHSQRSDLIGHTHAWLDIGPNSLRI